MTRRLALLSVVAILAWGVWTIGVFAAGKAYSRAEWRHWLDVPDHPCRSVRQAVLARDALQWTIQWDPGDCRVEIGSWIDPYGAENPVVTDPKALDVDHLIPLGYAHAHGGAAWSKEKKAEYANALGYRWHLWAVSLHANRQKGDKGPSAWVPENLAVWCQYGEAWAVVAVVWKLELPDVDREAIRKLVETC